MTRDGSALDRLDASEYGEPDDHRPAHVVPCDDCERRLAVETVDGRHLCHPCAESDD